MQTKVHNNYSIIKITNKINFKEEEMKMKKLAAFVLTGVVAAGILTGCGGKGTSQTDTKEEGNRTQENITITLMTTGTTSDEGKDFMQDILPAEVKKVYPNVTVEVTKLPDEQYGTSILTKLATGQAPDIFAIWPKFGGSLNVQTAGEAGYLMDLSDLTFWDNVAESAKNDMSYNEVPYAVPDGISLLGTYYNKDMFQSNGLEVPTNWDDFMKCCQVLKDAGITPIVMGDKDSWVMQFGLYQLAANMLYPEYPEFDNDLLQGKAKFTDGEWAKILNRYKELYDKGYITSNSLGLGSAQAIQTFIDGEAAMIIDGSWDTTALTAKGAVDFERGFVPLPGNDAGKELYACASTSGGYAINAKTEHPEIVKDIFNLMYDGESDLFKAWSENNQSISVYEGVEVTNDLYKEVMDVYNTGKAFYFCNQMWYSGTEGELTAKFSEVIGNQGTTVEDVVESVQKKFDELSQK